MMHYKPTIDEVVSDLNDGEKQMLMELMFGSSNIDDDYEQEHTSMNFGNDAHDNRVENSSSSSNVVDQSSSSRTSNNKRNANNNNNNNNNKNNDEQFFNAQENEKDFTSVGGAAAAAGDVSRFDDNDPFIDVSCRTMKTATPHNNNNDSSHVLVSAPPFIGTGEFTINYDDTDDDHRSHYSGISRGSTSHTNDHPSITTASGTSSTRGMATTTTSRGGPKTGIAGAPSIVKLTTKRSKDILNSNRLENYLTILREDYIYNKQKQQQTTTTASPIVGRGSSLLGGSSAHGSNTSSAGALLSEMTITNNNDDASSIKSGSTRASSSNKNVGSSSPFREVGNSTTSRHTNKTILNTLKSILGIINTNINATQFEQHEDSGLGIISSSPSLPRTMLCFLHKDGIFLLMQYIKKTTTSTTTSSIMKMTSASEEADHIRNATVAVSIIRCLAYQLSTRRQELLLKENECIYHILNCMYYYKLNVEDEKEDNSSWSKGKQQRQEGEGLLCNVDDFYNVSVNNNLDDETSIGTTSLQNAAVDETTSSIVSDGQKSSSRSISNNSTTNKGIKRSSTTTSSNNTTSTVGAVVSVRNLRERKVLHEECIRALYCLAQKPILTHEQQKQIAAELSQRFSEKCVDDDDSSVMDDDDISSKGCADTKSKATTGSHSGTSNSDVGKIQSQAIENANSVIASIQFLSWNKNETLFQDDSTNVVRQNETYHEAFNNDSYVDGSDVNVNNKIITATTPTTTTAAAATTTTTTTTTGDAVQMIVTDIKYHYTKTNTVQKYSLGLLLHILRDVTTIKFIQQQHNYDSASSSSSSTWLRIIPASIWKNLVLCLIDILHRYNMYAHDSTSTLSSLKDKKKSSKTNSSSSSGKNIVDSSTTTTNSTSEIEVLQLGLMLLQRIIEIITYDCRRRSNSSSKSGITVIGDDGYTGMIMIHYMTIIVEPHVIECLVSILREHQRNTTIILQCLIILHLLCSIGSSSTITSSTFKQDSNNSSSNPTATTKTSGKIFSSQIRHISRTTIANTKYLMCIVRLLNKHKNEFLIQREGLRLLRTLNNLPSSCFIPPVPDFFWNIPMHQTILKQSSLYGKVHRGRNMSLLKEQQQRQQQTPPSDVIIMEHNILQTSINNMYHTYNDNNNYNTTTGVIGNDDYDNKSYCSNSTTGVVGSSSVVGWSNNDLAEWGIISNRDDSNGTSSNSRRNFTSQASYRVSALQKDKKKTTSTSTSTSSSPNRATQEQAKAPPSDDDDDDDCSVCTTGTASSKKKKKKKKKKSKTSSSSSTSASTLSKPAISLFRTTDQSKSSSSNAATYNDDSTNKPSSSKPAISFFRRKTSSSTTSTTTTATNTKMNSSRLDNSNNYNINESNNHQTSSYSSSSTNNALVAMNKDHLLSLAQQTVSSSSSPSSSNAYMLQRFLSSTEATTNEAT